MNQSIKKIVDFPIVKIIIAICICFSLFVGIQNFVSKPIFYSLISDKNIADPIIHCISIIVLLSSYYYVFRFYDKRKITELSFKKLPIEMFGGFSLGFLMISMTIVILFFLGCYEIIEVTSVHYSVRLFTVLMIAALIEDLFNRALIVRICENWIGTNLTIIVGMLMETWHMFNPNANLFSLFTDLTWGFTMTMLFVYTKRLWLPYFFHIGWNFAQPFYGSNLTGLDDMGSIIESRFNGSEFLTGGAVGVENSIFTVVFLLSLGISLYYFAKKEGKIVNRNWKKSS